VTDAWGANTFPVRKQLPNLSYLKFVDPLMVFLTFSSNKHWWWLRVFSFLGRRTREPRFTLPPKGRLWQLATPLGTGFRELGLLNLVQYHDFPFCRFLQAFRKAYGKIWDLATVEVSMEAIASLTQYYDQPLRCFTFEDFQLVPTVWKSLKKSWDAHWEEGSQTFLWVLSLHD